MFLLIIRAPIYKFYHSGKKSRKFYKCLLFSGCIRYKGAKIQLLDLPGIIEGAKDGKGRGRQVIAVARTASLIFIGKLKQNIRRRF